MQKGRVLSTPHPAEGTISAHSLLFSLTEEGVLTQGYGLGRHALEATGTYGFPEGAP